MRHLNNLIEISMIESLNTSTQEISYVASDSANNTLLSGISNREIFIGIIGGNRKLLIKYNNIITSYSEDLLLYDAYKREAYSAKTELINADNPVYIKGDIKDVRP